MTTKLWITRTQPAAERSAQAWKEAGFDPVIAPLLMVETVESDDPLDDNTALIFTSAHGVRHCGLKGNDRPVYTVGNATAQMARDQGFTNVTSADGDWRDLVKIIEDVDQSYLHFSGADIRGQIVETLRNRGIKAERRIVYRTNPVEDWPISVNQIGAVALYSPKASEILMSLPKQNLSHLRAFCLSEAVAAPLSGLDVRIAKKPTEADLIACSRPSDA